MYTGLPSLLRFHSQNELFSVTLFITKRKLNHKEFLDMFLGGFAQNYEKWLLALSCLSVRLHGTRLPLHRFSWLVSEDFFENLSRNFKLDYTLHEDLRTFMVISGWILLRMRNVSDNFVQKIKTHFVFSISPPPPQNGAFYGIKWGKISRRMRWAGHVARVGDRGVYRVLVGKL